MIDFPEPHELEELKAYKEPYCVTIYVPLLDPSGASNPNKIELKNLLRQTKIALLDTAISKRDLRKTLRPVQELLKDYEFWPRHQESLALFMHSRFFRHYHIPDHQTTYMLTVERGFNLEPLLKAMHENLSYFVLALGHKNVQLYEGNHFHLRTVHLKDFPANMDATLHYDENPKWHETHTIAPTGNGKGSEAYHGQYNVSQVDKEMLEEFFRTIDHRLHYYLSSQHKPLILAGVNYLLPIYRKVNTYSYLWPKSIKGNIANEHSRVIQDKAWALVSRGG